MSSTAGTALLLAVIVVLLVAGFVVFWVRDRSRAQKVAHDDERVAPPPPADHPERH